MRTIESNENYSVANAFAAITNTDSSLPDVVTDKLAMDPLQDPVTMLPLGVDRAIYSANCTAILAAALDANAGVSFPIAKVSTVIKADYQSTENGELGLIRGVFNSPFFQLYRQGFGRDGAAFAHFLLWDWYRIKNTGAATIPANPYYALDWFSGYSMYWVNKDARTFNGSVDLSASASYLGLASVSSTASDTYKTYGATQIENYRVAALRPTDNTPQSFKFQPLDSPSDIVKWTSQNVFAVLDTSTYSQILHQNPPETHQQVIAGLPQNLCDHKLWQPDQATVSGAGKLAVTGEKFTPTSANQQIPTCALTVTFTPDASLFTGPSPKTVDFTYSLDTSIADQTLQVSATPMHFQTSALPFLTTSVVAPAAFTSTPATGGFVLEWNLKTQLQDDPNDRIDPTAMISVISPPTFSTCKPAAGPIGVATGSPTLDSSGQLAVKVQQYIMATKSPDPAAADNGTCTASATFRFKTTHMNLVDLPIPSGTLITYPNLTATPPIHLMTRSELTR